MTDGSAGAAHPARGKAWDVVRVASGNFLEMYDFMVFGYFAAAIGRDLFPGRRRSPRCSNRWPPSAPAFLMRPLGAVSWAPTPTATAGARD